MRLWPRKNAHDAALLARVEQAEAQAREATEAAGELVRVIANSPMLGAPPALPVGGKLPLYAYDRPITFSTPQAPQRRPQSIVSLDDLRRVADVYDVLRSCIRHLKREVAAVPIRIVAREDDGGDGDAGRIQAAEQWFGRDGGLGGVGSSRSHFEKKILEDLLVIGAGCVYYRPARNGMPYEAIPIDAATIRPKVDAYGWPGPGEKVYEQWVWGVKVTEFSREELYFDGIEPVSYSPYPKSPVEWVLVTIFTAMKADEWNRLWLTDGNTPGEMLALPVELTPDQFKEFVEFFDAILAGNTRERVKTRFVPAGSSKVGNPTRKDQDFQEYEMQCIRRVCSLMGVAPAAIGYAGEQYKVSQEAGMDQTQRVGAAELLEWRKLFYDDMLCRLGYPDLESQNVTSQEEQASDRADRNVKLTGAGIKSINEARAEEGLDPIEGADELLVSNTLVPLDDLHAQVAEQTAQAEQATDQGEEQTVHAQQQTKQNEQALKAGPEKPEDKAPANRAAETELQAWERKVLNRIKSGRVGTAGFTAEHLPAEVELFIADELLLRQPTNADQVRAVFRAARAKLFPFAGTPWERKHFGHRWQVRRLQAERHDLVEPADD